MEPDPPICRVCRREQASLTFEHVPPQAAFNDERKRVYRIEDWLERDETGALSGGRIEQRGAGNLTLCASCNSKTGSWYGNELARAARSAYGILRDAQLDELDKSLDYTWADVSFKQSKTGPYPLRLIKQIVTMLLATSPPEFSLAHAELGDFVLDRERTGLPDRFQFYLALFAGPLARSTGVVVHVDTVRARTDVLVEVAFPPYSYVMTIDSVDTEVIETANITSFAGVGYDTLADIRLSMIIGFGHTPYPADYRSTAMMERDRELNEAAARGETEGPAGEPNA